MKRIKFLLLVLIALAACVPEPETAVTPTPLSATATPMSTATTLPTATAIKATTTKQPTSTPQATAVLATPEPPTATATAVPTMTPTPATYSSADLLVISPDNANQLTQLAQFGNGRIDSISWSPDGATFAVGSSQGIDLYDSQTLQIIQTRRSEYLGNVTDIRFSPSGQFLMVATSGGESMDPVTLWDANSGQYLRQLSDVFPTDFSPDGSIVYFEWATQQIVWQDPSSGENSRTLALPYAPRAFNLASETIVELYDSTTLRLYDMISGQLRHTLELPDTIDDIAFSPAGDLLATGSQDGFTRLWDVQTGEHLHELAGQVGRNIGIVFSPNGRTLATGNGEKTIRLWDTTTGQLLHQLSRQTGCGSAFVAFSPDSRELATVSGNKILFFNVADGTLQRTLDNGYCFAAEIDLAFRPNNSALMIAGGDKVYTLALPGSQLQQIAETDLPITSLAFSMDGQRMVWGGGTDRVWLQMWDLPTNQPLYTVTEGGGAVHKVTFSPDDRLLAVQGGPWETPVVELRAADSGELVASYPANSFAFTPDGRFLATSTTPYAPETTGIDLWDTTTFQLVRHFDQITLLAISPDGNLLATEGYGSVSVSWWNIASGERLHPLSPPEELIAVPAFNPDGRLFLTTIYYSNLTMLDAASGQGVWGQSAQTGVFSRDGRFLATVSYDGIVRLWGVPSSSNE